MQKIFSLATILLFSAYSFAQQVKHHELLLGGGGGISTLNYDNRSTIGLGGNVNFGYAYNFNKRWAIFSGLELDFYNAKSSLNNFTNTYGILVPAYVALGNGQLDYTADVQGFSEKQKAIYVNIPLMARYKYLLKKGHAFYGMAGVKLGIPLSGSYSGSIDQLTTSGYSYHTHQPHNNEPENGFDTYRSCNLSGDLNLKFSVALSLEAGYEWPLRENMNLYSGVYFDYGVNDISSENGGYVVNYNPADVPTPQLASITTASDKMGVLAAGVMLRLAIDFGGGQGASRVNKEELARQLEEVRRKAMQDSVEQAQELEAMRLKAQHEKARRDSVAKALQDSIAQAQRDSMVQAKAAEEAARVPIAKVSGVITDSETGVPLAAVVEVTNNDIRQLEVRQSSNPTTGEYAVQLPLGSNYGLAVKADNYLFHSENINLENKKKVPTPIIRNVKIKKIKLGAKIALRNTSFESGKSDLTEESAMELQNVVAMLKQNPTMRLEVSGHTDDVGSEASNKALSDARAKSVVSYLVKKGIDPNRLTSIGWAFYRPLTIKRTPEGRALNRRIEIKIVGN